MLSVNIIFVNSFLKLVLTFDMFQGNSSSRGTVMSEEDNTWREGDDVSSPEKGRIYILLLNVLLLIILYIEFEYPDLVVSIVSILKTIWRRENTFPE